MLKVQFAALILDPEFYAALSESIEPNIKVSDVQSSQENPDYISRDSIPLKRKFHESSINDCNAVASKEVQDSVQRTAFKAIKVTETAPVMEAFMSWLYEDIFPEEAEILAGMYRAARKYQQKALCDYIEAKIEQFKDNHNFIIKMMQAAFEQENEDIIKRLIPTVKADTLLRRSPEYKTIFIQYGFEIAEYFCDLG